MSLEMTPDLVREWCTLYKDQIAHPSDIINSAEQIVQNLGERATALQFVVRPLYNRWLDPCRPFG